LALQSRCPRLPAKVETGGSQPSPRGQQRRFSPNCAKQLRNTKGGKGLQKRETTTGWKLQKPSRADPASTRLVGPPCTAPGGDTAACPGPAIKLPTCTRAIVCGAPSPPRPCERPLQGQLRRRAGGEAEVGHPFPNCASRMAGSGVSCVAPWKGCFLRQPVSGQENFVGSITRPTGFRAARLRPTRLRRASCLPPG